MENAEDTLIRRAQQGDPLAFERLIAPYDRRLLSLAFDMVGNLEEAQDVFQDAMLSAYQALPKFRRQSAFFTWLYKIVINKALKYRQKQPRAHLIADTDRLEETPVAPRHDDPEHQMLTRELQRAIHLALGTLSRHERLAFVLCHHQGQTIRQAAQAMKCSEGAIKSYLFRARQKLKPLLRPYWEVK